MKSHGRVGAPPPVALRPTTSADIAAVTDWERRPENAAFVELWPAARHRAALSDPTVAHLMIEFEGEAVGYAILGGIANDSSTRTRTGPSSSEPATRSVRAPVVELRRIVVAKKGLGIGQAAVDLLLAHAFDVLGASEVWLDFVAHNGRAAHVYAKCGFQVDPGVERWAVIDGSRTLLTVMRRGRI